MNERGALASRIECSLYLGTLTGRDRDIILDALRAPVLPSEDDLASYILDKADVEIELSDYDAALIARAVLALLGKTGVEK